MGLGLGVCIHSILFFIYSLPFLAMARYSGLRKGVAPVLEAIESMKNDFMRWLNVSEEGWWAFHRLCTDDVPCRRALCELMLSYTDPRKFLRKLGIDEGVEVIYSA